MFEVVKNVTEKLKNMCGHVGDRIIEPKDILVGDRIWHTKKGDNWCEWSPWDDEGLLVQSVEDGVVITDNGSFSKDEYKFSLGSLIKSRDKVLKDMGIQEEVLLTLAGNFKNYFFARKSKYVNWLTHGLHSKSEMSDEIRSNSYGNYSNLRENLYEINMRRIIPNDERCFFLAGIDEPLQKNLKEIHLNPDLFSHYVMSHYDFFGRGGEFYHRPTNNENTNQHKFMCLGSKSWVNKLISDYDFGYLKDVSYSIRNNKFNIGASIEFYEDEEVLYLNMNDYENVLKKYVKVGGFWG